MRTFEVGNIYTISFAGDHTLKINCEVLARTACTITASVDGKIKKLRISKGASEFNNAETVYPLGQYSKCPVLRA